MADNVTNESPLETLKAIQLMLADFAIDIVDLKADMRGLKGHMAAFMQSEICRARRRHRLDPTQDRAHRAAA